MLLKLTAVAALGYALVKWDTNRRRQRTGNPTLDLPLQENRWENEGGAVPEAKGLTTKSDLDTGLDADKAKPFGSTSAFPTPTPSTSTTMP